MAAAELALRSPPSVVADDQRDKSPDSNPSAKIESVTAVGLDVGVEVRVAGGVELGVDVAVLVGVAALVGVDVCV